MYKAARGTTLFAADDAATRHDQRAARIAAPVTVGIRQSLVGNGPFSFAAQGPVAGSARAALHHPAALCKRDHRPIFPRQRIYV